MEQGKSFSVINTHKSMLIQTLKLLNNSWCENPIYLARFMKGLFNKNPPVPKYKFTWDVSVVINFLRKLYPLKDLTIKMLTLKLVSLISLTTAPRAQTLVALNLDNMNVCGNKVVFTFDKLLKTSRPGKSFQLELLHCSEEDICAMHTLLCYIERTKHVRKSRQLLVSYCSFESVSTSTVARWLKEVLKLSGVDISVFKAHSYRSAAVSAAYNKGCSLKDILSSADWASASNFQKFYLREVEPSNNVSFAEAVLH